MSADVLQIVYEFLTEPGTDLNVAVADRIWCPIAKPGYANEQAALIFHPETQAPEAPRNILSTVLVFKCYGGDMLFGSARGVASKLYDRLHMAHGTTASGRIIRSRCLQMFQGADEPDQGWPVHVAKYEVITHGN